jgi:hypothetical protein
MWFQTKYYLKRAKRILPNINKHIPRFQPSNRFTGDDKGINEVIL